MAGFIRRFDSFPSLDVIQEIEGVNIIDQDPPQVGVGRVSGTLALVGEWPKGPFNTPTLISSARDIQDVFGGFSLSLSNPLSYAPLTNLFANPYSNGCASVWLEGKTFRRLVLVRADLDLAEGVHLTLTATPAAVLTAPITIPAGTRVRTTANVDEEWATSRDITFAVGVDTATATGTAFSETAVSYSTRTVGGVPVYCTRGQNQAAIAGAMSVDTGDLFRMGLGVNTENPTLGLSVSTAAVDTIPINGAVLTALTSGAIDLAYEDAIDATLPGEEATDLIEIIASARQSDTIRDKLSENARTASAIGTGRVDLLRPPIGTLPATAISGVDPGVGDRRRDSNIYCYPHFEQRFRPLEILDPNALISSSLVLVGADAAAGHILSTLNPELNPGQKTGLLTYIRKLEDGLTGAGLPTKFDLDDYKSFKTNGIFALRRDSRIAEWVFQSGVTSVDPSLFPAKAPIKRRRMANFLQDSLATITLNYSKGPNREDAITSWIGDAISFLELMLSRGNPTVSRIAAYSLDSKSGNTPQLQGIGVFILLVRVQLLDSLDFIVLQTTIGETVSVEVVG